MAKIVKPDLTYQWASAAGGGSVAPSSGKIQTGHITNYGTLSRGGGYIRADAINTSSSDFDFGAGDFSVECTVTAVRVGGVIWLYVDGVKSDTSIDMTTKTIRFEGSSSATHIGKLSYIISNNSMNGYIRDLRIKKKRFIQQHLLHQLAFCLVTLPKQSIKQLYTNAYTLIEIDVYIMMRHIYYLDNYGQEAYNISQFSNI